MSDISPVGPGAPGIVPTPGVTPGILPAAANRISLNGHHEGIAPVGAEARVEPPATPRLPDTVELSDRAILLDSILGSAEVRQDRVAAARQAIERGDYPNDDQMAIAIDRMMAKLRD